MLESRRELHWTGGLFQEPSFFQVGFPTDDEVRLHGTRLTSQCDVEKDAFDGQSHIDANEFVPLLTADCPKRVVAWAPWL